MKPIIALLSDYPIDLRSFAGGVETSVAGLLEGLQDYADEFEFHVVSVPRGLALEKVVMHQQLHFRFLALSSPWLRPRFPFRVLRVLEELRLLAPALVHCQGSIDMALASILGGYPRLLTIHGVKRQEAGRRIGWESWSAAADALIEPFVFRHFTHFVCISDYAAQVAGPGKQKHFVPNAVRSSFFNVHRASGEHPPKLLYVGLLSPLKRPTDLIEAHHRLRIKYPSLETAFCGNLESQRYWDELRSFGTDGIRFLGRLDLEGIMRELSGATALVLPSSQENAPLVAAEAMAAGVPVVATRVGGTPDLLKQSQLGILYEVGDVAGLVSALERLLAGPEYAHDLARAAQTEARKRFLPNNVAADTVVIYRSLLQSSSTG